MINILIVDDEELICEGIALKIKRLIPDTTILGAVSSSDLALDVIRSKHPHVVITDIMMPKTDGLQLIKMAQDIYDDIIYIIISGYKDFEFAKTAMQLGVQDYLLKPIKDEQLIKVFNRVKNLISEKNEKSYLNAINQNIAFLIDSYLSDLINIENDQDLTTLKNNLELLNVKFTHPFFIVFSLILEIDAGNDIENIEDIKQKIKKIIPEFFTTFNKVIQFENRKNRKQIVVIINNDNKLGDYLYKCCNELMNYIISNISKNVIISIGREYTSLAKIPQSYNETVIAYFHKSIGNSKVINIAEFPKEKQMSYYFEDEDIRILKSFIISADIANTNILIDRIFAHLKTQNLSYENLKHLCINFYFIFYQLAKEVNIKNIKYSQLCSDNFLSKYSDIDSMSDYIKDCANSISEHIMEQGKSDGYKAVEKIKQYINEYYYTDIKLTTIAKKFNLNENYLSQLFKTLSDCSFSNYLTDIRIEQAKNLLRNSQLTGYKIAEIVGYKNFRYFSYVFQKKEGCSPSEFRKKA